MDDVVLLCVSVLPGCVQECLQQLSSLRSDLILSSEALLDASGKLSFDFQQHVFDAALGELPVATWMAAFLALHGDELGPQVSRKLLTV
jgi:hypothetical protein